MRNWLEKKNRRLLFFIFICAILFSAITYYKFANSGQFYLTTAEKEWLNSHKVIKYSGDPAYFPFDYSNKLSQNEGLSKDYLNIIEKKLGIRFQYEKSDSWTVALNKAKNKTIDFISNVGLSENREEFLSFTKSYLDLPFYIVTNNKNKSVKKIADLAGKRVAVPKDYLITDFLQENYSQIKLEIFEDNYDFLKKINTGEVDATISELGTISYYVKKLGIYNLRVADEIDFHYYARFGVLKENRMLVFLLNKALSDINEKKRNQIFEKWVDIKFDDHDDYKKIVKIISLIALIASLLLFIIFFFFVILKKRVKEKTVALENIKENLNNLVQEQTHQLKETVKLLEKTIDEKDKIFAVISHDLKNSISGISVVADILFNDYQTTDEESKIEMLQQIKSTSKETYNLLINLLDWETHQLKSLPSSLTNFNIKDVLKECGNASNSPARNKKININIDSTDIYINSDCRKIECIVRNLITNAIKYTDKGGVVTLYAGENSESVWFSVKDNGVGMNEEMIQSLLKSNSFRSKPGTDGEIGTGIGLTLVNQFVEDINGKFVIESKIGIGTEMKIIIPKHTNKKV